ncbi:hypothetical protein QFZ72_002860 [Bacillus sp. V2I10]|nr:hypothetical protein [Bacillus sp. V2I10]
MTEANKFPLISGYLSLDLVNTEIVRRGQRQDLLLSEEDLMEWLHVIKEENSYWDDPLFLKVQERIGQVLLCILEMRTVLRDYFELITDGQPFPDQFIAFLEKTVEKAPFTYKLMHKK